jgi:hypothetical protein
VFGTILAAVEIGKNNGEWVRPEPEKDDAPEAPEAEEIEAAAEEG